MMNKMVTVYHGTTANRAEKIIGDFSIRVTDDNNRRYSDTREGYVYVTTLMENAMGFSTIPSKKDNCSEFVVFSFIIPEFELEVDQDESKWESVLVHTNENTCFRIERNIDLVQDQVKLYRAKDNYEEYRKKDYSADYQAYVEAICREIKESEWVSYGKPY